MRAPSSPTPASQTAINAAADSDVASRRIARVTAHPLRAVLPAAQRTSQGDWAAIEIVVVEIETAAGHIGWGECLARRGATAYAAFIDGVLAPLLLGAGSARPAAALAAHALGAHRAHRRHARRGDRRHRHRAVGPGRAMRRAIDRAVAGRHGPAHDAGLCVVDQLVRRRRGRARGRQRLSRRAFAASR